MIEPNVPNLQLVQYAGQLAWGMNKETPQTRSERLKAEVLAAGLTPDRPRMTFNSLLRPALLEITPPGLPHMSQQTLPIIMVWDLSPLVRQLRKSGWINLRWPSFKKPDITLPSCC